MHQSKMPRFLTTLYIIIIIINRTFI